MTADRIAPARIASGTTHCGDVNCTASRATSANPAANVPAVTIRPNPIGTRPNVAVIQLVVVAVDRGGELLDGLRVVDGAVAAAGLPVADVDTFGDQAADGLAGSAVGHGRSPSRSGRIAVTCLWWATRQRVEQNR